MRTFILCVLLVSLTVGAGMLINGIAEDNKKWIEEDSSGLKMGMEVHEDVWINPEIEDQVNVMYEKLPDSHLELGGPDESGKLILKVGVPEREPTEVFEDPVIRFYTDDVSNLEYVDFMLDDENAGDVLFLLGKELLCSYNPFAMELVEKYKITSDTIKCPEPVVDESCYPSDYSHGTKCNPQM